MCEADKDHLTTTDEHYTWFKESCKLWQERLHLGNWKLYYEHKKLDDAYARCSFSAGSTVATIAFGTSWNALRPLTQEEIWQCALHEVLHLLLGHCHWLASSRYTSEEEVNAANESLVNNLCRVILAAPEWKNDASSDLHA